MKRALFASEFRTALFIQIGILMAVLFGLAVAIYFNALGPGIFLLEYILIVSAFVPGMAGLSKRFQTKQLPLLLTLPISRFSVWCIVVGAYLTASLASVVAIVSMLHLTPELSFLSVPLVLLYLTFFSGGVGAGIMSDPTEPKLNWRMIQSLLIGTLPTLIACYVLAQTSTITVFLAKEPTEPFLLPGRHGQIAEEFGGLDFSFAVFGCLLFIGAEMGISLYAFNRGEIHLTKVKVRIGTLMATIFGIFALILPLSGRSGIFGAFDDWAAAEAAASSDGKHVAVLEKRAHYPKFARLTIVDTSTGNVEGQRSEYGLHRIVWPANSTALAGWSTIPSMPPYGLLLRPRHELTVFSMKVEKLRSLVPSEIVDIVPGSNGKPFIFVREGSSGSFSSYDLMTGQSETLGAAPLQGPVTVDAIGDSYVVDFQNLRSDSSIWQLGSGVKELPWAGSRLDARPRHIIHGTVYTVSTAANTELEKLYPRPRSEGSIGAFLVTSANRQSEWLLPPRNADLVRPKTTYIDDQTWLFYMEARESNRSGSLFVFDRARHNWKTAARNLPLGDSDLKFLSYARQAVAYPGIMAWIRLDGEDGLAAYAIPNGSNYAMKLYDARLDKTIHLADIPTKTRPARVELLKVLGLSGVLVQFGDAAFIYDLDSGLPNPVKLGAKSYRDLLYMDDRGNQIYRDADTGQIMSMGSNQSKRLLWPK